MSDSLRVILPAAIYLLFGVGLGVLYANAAFVFKPDGKPHCPSLPSDHELVGCLKEMDSRSAAHLLETLRDVDYSQAVYSNLYPLVIGEAGHERERSEVMLLSVLCCAIFTGSAPRACGLILGFAAAVFAMRKLNFSCSYVESETGSTSVQAGLSTAAQIQRAYAHCGLLDARCRVLRHQAKRSVPFRSAFWCLLGFIFAVGISLGSGLSFYSSAEIDEIKSEAEQSGYSSGYDDGYYDAQNSASWDEGEFLSDVDDAIAPLVKAYHLIENHLLEGDKAPELSEIYDLMYEGLDNLDATIHAHFHRFDNAYED